MYMYMIVHVCCITFWKPPIRFASGATPAVKKMCNQKRCINGIWDETLEEIQKERLSKIQGTELTLPPLSAIPLKEEGLQLPKDRQDTVCRAPTHIWPAFPEKTNVAPLHFKRHHRLSPSQTPLAQTVARQIWDWRNLGCQEHGGWVFDLHECKKHYTT